MSLVHGRDLSAEELERTVGREFSVQRFASLCNAIIWAIAKPRGLAQAAFTERVFVRDNGVDAEWLLDVPEDAVDSHDVIGGGRNVFQYKQRDLTSRDRNRIIGDLRSELRGAAHDVVTRTQRALQRYALLTNIHLTLDEKAQLASAIGVDYEGELAVHVFGAAELAAALNSLPHLRSSFFATAHFATWSRAWESHERASITGVAPALVGRQLILDSVRAAIDDDSIRAVLIAGTADIGKSRIALAATQHREVDAVFALDPVSLTIADLLAISSPDQRVIVTVEDPDFNRIDELVTAALAENLKLVLTVPSSGAADLVNYGRDPRVKLFSVEALSDDESAELLRALGARLDYSVQSWVVEQAGGNPGILLAASSIGPQLRVEGPAFREQVGAALATRARTVVTDAGIETLRSLSVMTGVGFSGHAESELQIICRLLGGSTPNQVIGHAKALSRAGFLRIRGNYLEVAPPILANYLADAALAGRPRELAQLFSELPPFSRPRLLRRVRQLTTDAVETFWHELFERGPLSTFEGVLAEVLLLRLIAPAVPTRVAPLVLRGLQGQVVQERSGIAGSTRRELVWTIDQLLFRKTTSATALRSLSLLAEAENEQWTNNATGVFAECFHPFHPQLPLPLEDRLPILRELLAEPTTPERQLLTIKSIDNAFQSHGTTLRRSEGPEPFDSTPTFTYQQLYDYQRELMELSRGLMNATDHRVTSAAGEALVSAIGIFAATCRPDQGIGLFEEIGPAILEGNLPIKLESYVRALQFTVRKLSAQADRFKEAISRATELLQAVEEASYSTQVRRWVGSWEYGDQEKDEDGQTIFHGDMQVRRLARGAAEDPTAVPEDLLAWLLSKEAKRAHEYFWWLGRHDAGAKWQERIEQFGRDQAGQAAFAGYFGGRASIDPQAIDVRLDELSAQGLVRGEGIVGATRHIPGNRNGVDRMIRLLTEGKVDARVVEKQLMTGGWMKTLTGDEACELLSTIAGADLERAELVVDFLAMWVHSGKPIEDRLAELAWRAIESAPEGGEAWDFDLVANALAPGNMDRAFALLERLLALPNDRKSWEPLDRHGGNQFWNALWRADRKRCLRVLFEAGARSPLVRWKVSWHLPEIMNLERDGDLLLAVGRQSEESASFISSVITAGQPRFWPVAVSLLSIFPDAETVRRNVALAAEHMGQVISGPWSKHLDTCAMDVERAIEQEQPTGRVRQFLQELAGHLRSRAEAQRRAEEDEAVNL